jgi:hypothetical protein
MGWKTKGKGKDADGIDWDVEEEVSEFMTNQAYAAISHAIEKVKG